VKRGLWIALGLLTAVAYFVELWVLLTF